MDPSTHVPNPSLGSCLAVNLSLSRCKFNTLPPCQPVVQLTYVTVFTRIVTLSVEIANWNFLPSMRTNYNLYDFNCWLDHAV